MPVTLQANFDRREMERLLLALNNRAVMRAVRKAGSTGLRDMRSEASKRVRARKRLKVRAVSRALVPRRPARGAKGLDFALDVRGDVVRLADYPHRQTRRGVSVTVNRGKRTLVRSAFRSTMRSGHQGVFIREGRRRLPIRELLASRPVDALLHEGEAEAVAERGRESFVSTFRRVLPMEMERK